MPKDKPKDLPQPLPTNLNELKKLIDDNVDLRKEMRKEERECKMCIDSCDRNLKRLRQQANKLLRLEEGDE